MSRYRKIDPRIWNDEKFRLLSDHAKLVFLFLLTHPHMTSLGAMRATIPGLAAELNWSPEAFGEAFGEVLSKTMAKHDEQAAFVWLPHFLKYNKPESPNVVKSWINSDDLLPECPLKDELLSTLKDFLIVLPKAFAEALPKDFLKAFRKPSPNQEQEQEKEKEKEGDARGRTKHDAKPKADRSQAQPPEFEFPSEYDKRLAKFLETEKRMPNPGELDEEESV